MLNTIGHKIEAICQHTLPKQTAGGRASDAGLDKLYDWLLLRFLRLGRRRSLSENSSDETAVFVVDNGPLIFNITDPTQWDKDRSNNKQPYN